MSIIKNPIPVTIDNKTATQYTFNVPVSIEGQNGSLKVAGKDLLEEIKIIKTSINEIIRFLRQSGANINIIQ